MYVLCLVHSFALLLLFFFLFFSRRLPIVENVRTVTNHQLADLEDYSQLEKKVAPMGKKLISLTGLSNGSLRVRIKFSLTIEFLVASFIGSGSRFLPAKYFKRMLRRRSCITRI